VFLVSGCILDIVLTVIFVRLWAYIAESEALMVYGHGQPPQHLPNLLLILVTAQHCTCTLMIYYEMQMFIVAAFNIMFMWPVKFFCYTILDSVGLADYGILEEYIIAHFLRQIGELQ